MIEPRATLSLKVSTIDREILPQAWKTWTPNQVRSACFTKDIGLTSACPGCAKPGKASHSLQCRSRQRAWELVLRAGPHPLPIPFFFVDTPQFNRLRKSNWVEVTLPPFAHCLSGSALSTKTASSSGGPSASAASSAASACRQDPPPSDCPRGMNLTCGAATRPRPNSAPPSTPRRVSTDVAAPGNASQRRSVTQICKRPAGSARFPTVAVHSSIGPMDSGAGSARSAAVPSVLLGRSPLPDFPRGRATTVRADAGVVTSPQAPSASQHVSALSAAVPGAAMPRPLRRIRGKSAPLVASSSTA